MDIVTQVSGILIILFVLVVSVVVTQFIRRRSDLFTLRVLPAYEVVPDFVGLAIESNRPLHLGLGSSGIGGASTLLTIASAELFFQVAQRGAIGDVPPVLTLSNASALPLAQDTLRRAYQQRNRVDRFRYSSVRWYPTGNRSLAYAAALTAVMGDDRISASIFAGRFGTELALPMEAARRRRLPQFGVSDQLEGQAVAYAFSDYVLIGEEIFAAGAYLSDQSSLKAVTVTLDVLRWTLVASLIGLLLYGLLNSGG